MRVVPHFLRSLTRGRQPVPRPELPRGTFLLNPNVRREKRGPLKCYSAREDDIVKIPPTS
jgi:hypothetical protein